MQLTLKRVSGNKALLYDIMKNLCQEFNKYHTFVKNIIADFPMRSLLKGLLGHTSKFACEIETCRLKDGEIKWRPINVIKGVQRTYRKSIEIKKKLLRIEKVKLESTDARFREFLGETCYLATSKLTNHDPMNPDEDNHFDHIKSCTVDLLHQKDLGMFSNKMPIMTIFGHKHFRQKFSCNSWYFFSWKIFNHGLYNFLYDSDNCDQKFYH